MTEFEFEGLLQSAIRDSKNVPDEINQRLKQRLYKKSRYKRILKSVPVSMAACVVIGVIVASVMFNQTPNDNSDIISNPMAVNEKIATTDIAVKNMARSSIEESIAFDNMLIKDIDNVVIVAEKVKEYMKDNPDYEFYDEFKGLSGNERCYFEESGELVVIFDAGAIAPKEHGEIFINVGIIE